MIAWSSMGFEQEARRIYLCAAVFGTIRSTAKPFEVTLTSAPDLSHLDMAEKSCVQVEETSAGTFTMTVTGNIDKQLVDNYQRPRQIRKIRPNFLERPYPYRMAGEFITIPARRSVSIPQLCLEL